MKALLAKVFRHDTIVLKKVLYVRVADHIHVSESDCKVEGSSFLLVESNNINQCLAFFVVLCICLRAK